MMLEPGTKVWVVVMRSREVEVGETRVRNVDREAIYFTSQREAYLAASEACDTRAARLEEEVRDWRSKARHWRALVV